MIGLWNFIRANSDYILFSAILLVVLILFLKEFKITSKNSWGVLIGMTALGSLFAYKAWQRKKLLEELEDREKALEEIEKRYTELKDKAQITEEAFQKAKNNLERAKVDAATAILRADEEHAARAAEIENEFKDKSADDLVADIKNIIGSN